MRPVILALMGAASLIGCSAAALEGARYQVTLHPVSNWTKVCSKGEASAKPTCYTSRRFGTDPRKPPVLELSVRDIAGDATHVLRFLMPVGLRADRGLTVSVDGGDKQPGLFKLCLPNGCFAEAKFGNPMLAAMRRGGTMQIVTTDGTGLRIDFYLSLAGFAAAYDGAAGDAIVPPRKGLPATPFPRAGGSSI